MFQEDINLVKRIASEIANKIVDEKIAKALADFKASLPVPEVKAEKKIDVSSFAEKYAKYTK